MDPNAPSLPPPQAPPGWTPPAPEPPLPPQVASSETNARIAYVLYLVSLAVGVTALVAVVVAYVNQGSAPEGLRTHYRYQIRTFWIGLLYGALGVLLSVVVVGFALLLFVAVWLVVRCVKGLKLLGERQPIPDPGTWLW